MAWCRQAPSHYLSQCWPRSMLPYGVSRPQWVNSLRPSDAYMHRNLTIIDSDKGLLPGWHQAIIWTNAGILLIGPLATNFILMEMLIFSFKKMHLKVSSGEWRPFCVGVNVLNHADNIPKHDMLIHFSTRRSENNTHQLLNQRMNRSSFMGQQVGNCKSFTLTHYLADIFAMHCGPRASL